MEYPILRRIYLLIIVFICQSCSFLNKNIPNFRPESTYYLYVNDSDNGIKAKITLLPSGFFVYNETSHEILGEHCQNNRGIWYQKDDTILLTTFFQNKNEDFLVEVGDIKHKDSVLIRIYSLQTEKPSDDFAFFNEKDSLLIPTSEGRLCAACTEIANLKRQLFLGIITDSEMSVSLECGKEYKYFIKDCNPIVMHEEKFIVSDSCLFEIGQERLYRRVNKSGR